MSIQFEFHINRVVIGPRVTCVYYIRLYEFNIRRNKESVYCDTEGRLYIVGFGSCPAGSDGVGLVKRRDQNEFLRYYAVRYRLCPGIILALGNSEYAPRISEQILVEISARYAVVAFSVFCTHVFAEHLQLLVEY